jgi:Xaa-Pro aminopeptidase
MKGHSMPTKSKLKNKNILLYAPSETDSNVLYATKFFCPDPFIFIRTAKGKRIYVMSDLEIDRARTTTNAHRVLSLAKYGERAESRTGKPPHVADVIAEVFRDLKIRGVTVPENFPAGIADRLRRLGVRVSAADDPFFEERLYKNADEVKAISKTMRATEMGMQAAFDVLRKSSIVNGWVIYKKKRLTAEILRKIANGTIFDQGCIPSHTIVAPGKYGCDPHDVGSGPIRAHQPVIIDIFPRSEKTGYFGDMTRTFVKGKASDQIKKMYQAVLAGQKLGLKMAGHGVKTASIHRAIMDLFSKHGFKTGKMSGRMQGFFHGTGHGLGMDIHEPPRIAVNKLVLEKGMVVTVEPGLYYYPIGGVRIEDTVLITAGGIKNLTRFPKFLEIK